MFAMTALELARLQFGIVTVFHFIFVPVTIGMSFFVAICQTLHYRTGEPVYQRMTIFWGKLMLISFAVGVVTGIVQEFQFGMNWSNYSRYVGDIFGAPLAMEGLLAFFLESTFIGLWIFGRGKLSPKVHLACIWAFAAGTILSAYFILAANSWMQHPVGFEFNEQSGRAEMTSIWAVLTNSTALFAFAHTILGALATAGMLMLGRHRVASAPRLEPGSSARRCGCCCRCVFVTALLTVLVGHFNGALMDEQQPMKMAAAEALWDTEERRGVLDLRLRRLRANPGAPGREHQDPAPLSLMATNSWNGEVRGMNDIQQRVRAALRARATTRPIVGVTYWTFRFMVGAGTLMVLIALFGLWQQRRGAFDVAALPVAADPGRRAAVRGQLDGLDLHRDGPPAVGRVRAAEDRGRDSPTVSTGQVLLTLIGFTLLYTRARRDRRAAVLQRGRARPRRTS